MKGIVNIKYILEDEIPKALQNIPFFEKWIEDMANAIMLFCDTQKSDFVVAFLVGFVKFDMMVGEVDVFADIVNNKFFKYR